MPYRSAAGLLMALGGLLAVAGLVLIGIDVYAASRRGPRWKRRLLGAGLAVLGMLGMGAGYVEASRPSCYLPASAIGPDLSPSLQRLSQQSLLLHQLSADEKLAPETARKALAAAEAALAEASRPDVLRGLQPEERRRAEVFIQRARTQVDQLKARLDAGRLEDSPDWKVIAEAWDFILPFAKSGKSTAAQRREVEERSAAIRAAADRLVAGGLMAPAERDLLMAVADLLRGDVLRSPPVDDPDRTWVYPGRPPDLSIMLLEAWRPAVEKLAADEHVHRAVVEKVLPAVEARLSDLGGMLKDESRLAGDRRVQARQTFEAVKSAVEKLRKLLDAGAQPPINAGGK